MRADKEDRHITAAFSVVFGFIAMSSAVFAPLMAILFSLLAIAAGYFGRRVDLPFHGNVGGRVGRVGTRLGQIAILLSLFFIYLKHTHL